MRLVRICLIVICALAISPAIAHSWSSPYYWYQESLALYNNNVEGRCGSGSDVLCIKFKDAGYPFGSTYADTTPNCYGKDWDGDGDFHVGAHNFEMRCWWGERYIYLIDTRKCNGWYEVDGLTTGNIVRVYDGRSCSGDWTGR